jgi:antitoxin (DNA-binding transcriptional repressor) of toxin-antitoxin stability system
MKFMTVREMRGCGAGLWRELPAEKEMVVTSNGRPIAILTSIEGGDFEQSLKDIRRARAVRAATELQSASLAKGTDSMPAEEIDDVIARTRAKRRTHAHRA